MVKLRKGRTKAIVEAAIDAALLAVEVYNKPRTTFRSQAFVSLMVIAWTRLFHAYFQHTIGARYFYKKPNGRYEIVDGERKAWELSKCIREYSHLSAPVEKNLKFFIALRNKIEHRHVETSDVDVLIFGECQALLLNFENLLIDLFGSEYSINEALVYSLQFSHLRTSDQTAANKAVLAKDVADIAGFVKKYRAGLTDNEFQAQEYSVKLIQIPRIANGDRGDAAIEFVRWDALNEDDKKAYDKVAVLVKDKKIKVEAANVDRLKPGQVVNRINQQFNAFNVTTNLHAVLWKLFRVRPGTDADDPFETNTAYCLYDEVHADYVYYPAWVDLVVHFLQSTGLRPDEIRTLVRDGETREPAEFAP